MASQEMDDLQCGAHVVAGMKVAEDGFIMSHVFKHHAVYLGKAYDILKNLSDDEKQKQANKSGETASKFLQANTEQRIFMEYDGKQIRLLTEETFLNDYQEPFYCVQSNSEDKNTDNITRRAFSRLGETKYSLATNQCEHFAEFCCTGEAKSYQVRAVLVSLGSSSLGALRKKPLIVRIDNAHVLGRKQV